MEVVKSSESERLARRINPLLYDLAPNYKKSGWFDSFGIIYKSLGTRHVSNIIERPPYPILMDKFKFRDLPAYIEKGDLLLLGTFYITGVVAGYLSTRRINSAKPRLLLYHGVSHMFTVAGIGVLLLMPMFRIRGLWDNGLRWKRPAPHKKYDYTKNLNEHKVYKHFRIKDP